MAKGLSLFEPSTRKSRERELSRNEREVEKRLAKEQRKFEREESVKPFLKVTVEEPAKKEYSYEGMGKPIPETKKESQEPQPMAPFAIPRREDTSAKERKAFAKRVRKVQLAGAKAWEKEEKEKAEDVELKAQEKIIKKARRKEKIAKGRAKYFPSRPVKIYRKVVGIDTGIRKGAKTVFNKRAARKKMHGGIHLI